MGERGGQIGGGLLLVALLALLVAPAAAQAGRAFAPLDRPGPKLRVQKQKLRNSVDCSPGVRNADRAPVLLVPATGVNSTQNFSWNYEPLLEQKGIPFCTSDMPGARNSNNLDIQLRGQYLTFAIRKMHRKAGRKIAIVGHSQGGMAMRWPLRFWPDTRKMVDDVIGFAGTNQGTTQANGCKGNTDCSPASAQQAMNSKFIRALNSRAQVFRPITYTEVYTELDETVTPPKEAASVHGRAQITNVAIQDVCPAAISEHLMVGTVDPAAAALALDALDHPGPADPSRIDPLVCAQVFQPGVDPIAAPQQIAEAINSIFVADGPTGGEPKLRCYVFKRKHQCRKKAKAEKGR